MEKLIEECQRLPEQKSQAWLDFRRTKLTSTDLGVISGGRERDLAELIQKKNGYQKSPFLGNEATRFGEFFESVAMDRFERQYNVKPILVNMIAHATDNRFVFSPDGILNTGEIIEIKCPFSRVINGSISTQYKNQIQLGMAIMYSHGFMNTKAYFVEYKPPNHNKKVPEDYEKEILSVKIVERDPDFFEEMQRKCQPVWEEIQLHKQCKNIDYNAFLKVKTKTNFE